MLSFPGAQYHRHYYIMEQFIYFLPIATALAVTLQRCLELATKREVIPGRVLEKTTLRLLILNGFAVLIIALVEYVLRVKGAAPLTYVAGVACAIISLLIRRRAIAALGLFWSLHVEIRDEHNLVKSGPFRWVRHPTYLSMIFELLAIILILNSYSALIIVLLFFVPVLIVRIRLEEKAMIARFGDSYRAYIRGTPAIFPWKIPTTETH